MKNHNPILWGVAAIALGILIMTYPVDAIAILIRIIGIVLLCVGAIQMISFIAIRKRVNMSWAQVPLGGVLGVVLGLMLVISPEIFISFFMIMLGVGILFLAAMQFISLVSFKKQGANITFAHYIFPVLMFISGFVFFAFPMDSTAWLVIFAGAWIMAYGIAEIAGYFIVDRLKEK